MSLFAIIWVTIFSVKTGGEPYSVFHENGHVGLKDDAGTILIPADYDDLGWSDGTFSLLENRITGYEIDHKWGIIDLKNTHVSRNTYSQLYPADSRTLIAGIESPVSFRTRFGLLDESGKTLLPFEFDGLKVSSARAITMHRYGSRFTYGLMSLDNKSLIPADYKNIYPIGSLRYAVENFDAKTALFDENGKRVSAFMIDSIGAFQNSVAYVYANGKMGLIDWEGKLVIAPRYSELVADSAHSVRGRLPDVWQLFTPSYKMLDTLEADSVAALAANRFRVRKGKTWMLTDSSFHPVTSDTFMWIGPYTGDLAGARVSDKMGVIDREGSYVLPPQYDAVCLDGGFIRARLTVSGKRFWQLYDATGKLLTEPHYQFIGPSNDGLFPVQLRNFHGLINRDGKEVVSCVYDSILTYDDQQAVVKFYGKYGIITTKEVWLVPPQENPLRLLNDTRYLEISDSTWILKSFDGRFIYFSTNPYELHPDYLEEFGRNGAAWKVDFEGCITSINQSPKEAYQSIQPPTEGYRLVRKDGKYGFVDVQGRLRIANRYEDARPYHEGLAPIKLLSRWGFIDTLENIVIQPLYDEVTPFDHHLCIVERDGHFGLINDQGEELLPLRYDAITRLNDSRFLLTLDGRYGVADRMGDLILQPKYQDLRDLNNGYMIIRLQDKYGVVDLGGVSIVPPLYDALFYDAAGNRFGGLHHEQWQRIALH